jgi:hypothetical protein
MNKARPLGIKLGEQAVTVFGRFSVEVTATFATQR